MAYRLPVILRTDERKYIFDVSEQTIITIDNGTICRIPIPCLYRHDVRHDRMMHDHLGWPSPDHPDTSCQLPPGAECATLFHGIDLIGEGYDSVSVSLDDPPEGLSATGDIDYGLVRLTITAMCESATSEDVEVPFAAYATGTHGGEYEDEETVQLRDVITKGIIRIVAGPIA